MPAFPWDEHKVGDFPDNFKFVKAGDTIAGEITAIRTTTFGGRSDPVPEITINTAGGELAVAASQTMLRSKLAEEAPQIGDKVKITYTGDGASSRAGLAPTKLFDVLVKKGEPPATVPAGVADDAEVDPFDL